MPKMFKSHAVTDYHYYFPLFGFLSDAPLPFLNANDFIMKGHLKHLEHDTDYIYVVTTDGRIHYAKQYKDEFETELLSHRELFAKAARNNVQARIDKVIAAGQIRIDAENIKVNLSSGDFKLSDQAYHALLFILASQSEDKTIHTQDICHTLLENGDFTAVDMEHIRKLRNFVEDVAAHLNSTAWTSKDSKASHVIFHKLLNKAKQKDFSKSQMAHLCKEGSLTKIIQKHSDLATHHGILALDEEDYETAKVNKCTII